MNQLSGKDFEKRPATSSSELSSILTVRSFHFPLLIRQLGGGAGSRAVMLSKESQSSIHFVFCLHPGLLSLCLLESSWHPLLSECCGSSVGVCMLYRWFPIPACSSLCLLLVFLKRHFMLKFSSANHLLFLLSMSIMKGCTGA